MAPRQAGRECPGELEAVCIAGIDLIECAEPGAGVILSGHNPLPVIRLILDLRLALRNQKQAEHGHAVTMD